METTAFKGTPVHTCGHLPHTGSQAPRFTLTRGDLTELRSEELKGRRIVLNIFPSLDTAVCATSVRKFNQLAASLDNTTVVAVSKDLPFAQSRFCTTEGIENLIAASAFRSPEFAREYGVEMVNGPLAGLLAVGSLSGLAAGLGKSGVFPGTAWGFLMAAGCLSFIPLWLGLTPEGPNWLSILITVCLWAAALLLWLARPKTK